MVMGVDFTGVPDFGFVYSTRRDALAAVDGLSDECVHVKLQAMLRSGSNPNFGLADGLNLVPRYYLGPFVVDLGQVPRCCGPEPDMVYCDPQPSWDAHVGKMVGSIVAGWEPPPLLFSAGGNLMDGNHRHEALVRAGRTRHSVIVVFDDPVQRSCWAQGDFLVTEVPLVGGHVTKGVVRVGSTVRRMRSSGDGFHVRLLRWLESQGFVGAPRYLGVDDRGRDVLTWVDGYVLPRDRMFSESQIFAAAQLLVSFHRCTQAFPGVGERFVVRHGDPKPRNMVFSGSDGVPVALIDFDNVSVGDPMSDLAWFTWTFAVRASATDRYPASVQVSNFCAAAEGLGVGDREGLLSAVVGMQYDHLVFARRLLRSAGVGERASLEGRVGWLAQEVEWMVSLQKLIRKSF